MGNFPLSMWEAPPSDLAERIETCLDKARESIGVNRPILLFFRADDIGVPGSAFARLKEVFARYRVPLSLAVVPAWLTRSRWQEIQKAPGNVSELFHWHQHGWRHINHEVQGKKSEFGSSRDVFELEKDLVRGRCRLEALIGKDFAPVFTPPWNRCNGHTLDLLKASEYWAVSRTRGSYPPAPVGLPEIDVNMDLHTRKPGNPGAEWGDCFDDLLQSLSSGLCGIMIHHRRMNLSAFEFLDAFLKRISRGKGVQAVHLKDLVRLQRNM